VLDHEVDWFVNRGGEFDRLPPPIDGILKSTFFPGLWLNSAALLGGDVNAVLATVLQGLSSPEHADFVARLEQTRSE
jgi:hypothetical protein